MKKPWRSAIMELAIKQKNAAIVISERKMRAIIFPDNDHYTAYCPELDIVTSQSTPDEALLDLIEAIKEYAEDYMKNVETYSKSPNRASHFDLVRLISSAKDWEIRQLLEVRHGELYLRSV
jgi:predicted RNase H-like HicB family nuclease